MLKFLLHRSLIGELSEYADSHPVQQFLNNEKLEPADVGQFVDALTAVEIQLVEADQFYNIIPFRKYVGIPGVVQGLLNILQDGGHEVFIVSSDAPYQQQLQDLVNPRENLDNVRCIASLNMDENEDFNNFILKTYQLPVYPLTFAILLSKWVKNFTFAPHAPQTFYIPEGENISSYINEIKALAREHGIKYLFLKDEFGFNSGAAVPYFIAPVDDVDTYCQLFYEKSRGVANLGGLVLEEFLAQQGGIDIYKSHYFGEIIPGECIHYHVDLNPFEGGAPYEQVIAGISEEPAEFPTGMVDLMNPVIERFYPYCFASVDCILSDGTPKIIDLNSMAGSLGYVQQLRNENRGNPFEFFLEHVEKSDNYAAYAAQKEYRANILAMYDSIRKVGPSFISGERLVSLDSGAERVVEELFF